jgi:hypothetical protein
LKQLLFLVFSVASVFSVVNAIDETLRPGLKIAAILYCAL